MKIETDLKAGCDDCGSNGSDLDLDLNLDVNLDVNLDASVESSDC